MKKKDKKTELLEIMNIILYEYKKGIHKRQIDSCGLCKKYHNLYFCYNCPMYIFVSKNISYPCMNRKCHPIDSFSLNDEIKTKRVIEFYERVIAKIESMTINAVRKSSFKFLIKIDNEVYDEIK